MLLDSLYQTIERLRDRIQSHQDKLSQSEALTRSTLIDPLLRALGWDTEDPDMVFPEHKLGSRFADYALLSNGKPIIVIEAKKLGASLSDAAEQGITNSVRDGIGYFAATDGRQWDLYETLKAAPIAEKKFVHFNILDDVPSDICLKALALWRRSAQDGVVRPGQTPLLEPQDPPPVSFSKPEPKSAPPPKRPSTPLAVVPTPGNWQTLAELRPEMETKRPLEIRFPDGSTEPITYWAEIPKATVSWLRQQGKLDETVIPIQIGRRYILSRDPIHPTGGDFTNAHKIGQFYLEANYNKVNHVKNANTIIEDAGKGVSADQFSVRLPE